jgi:four helix bundle protein
MGHDKSYLENLRGKMDQYVHIVYKLTKNFPKEEVYGSTSQLRRASLSIVLNFIEGYARQKKAVKKNFWEISYGSLKESSYLIHFALIEKYITPDDHRLVNNLSEEIGKMLWRALEPLSDD